MKLEDKIRMDSLKLAAVVLGQLADSLKDESTKHETKSLAWAVSWAVTELAKYKENEND